MGALDGQVVLVTGGSRGIGFGTAMELAQAGAKVAIFARSREGVARALRSLRQAGAEALGLAVDVTDEAQVQAGVAAVQRQWGRLDVLVNNVGIYPVRALTEMTLGEWEEVLRTNLTSAFLCVRAAVPAMLEAGRGLIVLIGSAPVTRPRARPDREAYYASKGGLMGLASGLTASLEERGVRTVVIHPGWTIDADEATEPARQLGRRDVGRAVLFLASQPEHIHVRELILTPREG